MASFSWPLNPPPTGGTGGVAQQDQVQIQLDRKLGTDIYFEGDYNVTPAGDYLVISGLDNLRAAIFRRLVTRPGEYTYVPEYGVGIQSFVKRRKTLTNIDKLRNAIKENLLRDPRIQAVDKVEIQDTGNLLTVTLTIRAEGRALRFRPFTFSESS